MTDRHQRGVPNVSSEGVEIGPPPHKREKIDNMRMTGMCGDHERSCLVDASRVDVGPMIEDGFNRLSLT